MMLKIERQDVSTRLDAGGKIARFLDAALEDGDAATIAAATAQVAQVKGMIAKHSGRLRNNLLPTLRSNGNPEFDAVVRLTKAMGSDLRVTSQASTPLEIIAAS